MVHPWLLCEACTRLTGEGKKALQLGDSVEEGKREAVDTLEDEGLVVAPIRAGERSLADEGPAGREGAAAGTLYLAKSVHSIGA